MSQILVNWTVDSFGGIGFTELGKQSGIGLETKDEGETKMTNMYYSFKDVFQKGKQRSGMVGGGGRGN